MPRLNYRSSLMILVCTLLVACAGTPQRAVDGSSAGERAAQIALAQVGAPYRYGGRGPDRFDCSGLVYYAYGRAGLKVPRTTSALLRGSQRVGVDALQPGDLLFFEIEGKTSHVAVYTGDGHFVHAPSSGKTVSVSALDRPYWRSRLVATGRLR